MGSYWTVTSQKCCILMDSFEVTLDTRWKTIKMVNMKFSLKSLCLNCHLSCRLPEGSKCSLCLLIVTRGLRSMLSIHREGTIHPTSRLKYKYARRKNAHSLNPAVWEFLHLFLCVDS